MRNYLARQANAVLDPDTCGEVISLYVQGCACMDGAGFGHKSGGKLLERRTLYPTEEPWIPVGFVAEGSDGTVASTLTHAASQGYHYRVRNVFGNGYVDERPPEPVRLDFDDAGDLIAAGVPARVQHLQARAAPEGRYDLIFEVSAYGQGCAPATFKAFTGDPIDYNAPLIEAGTGLAYLVYRGTPGRHVFRTPAYAEGTLHRFAVRAYSAAGAHERSEFSTDLRRAVVAGPAQFSQLGAHSQEPMVVPVHA